jgi:hypothetical protein
LKKKPGGFARRLTRYKTGTAMKTTDQPSNSIHSSRFASANVLGPPGNIHKLYNGRLALWDWNSIRKSACRVVTKINTKIEFMKKVKFLAMLALAVTSLFLTSTTTRADEEPSDAKITWTKHITAFLPDGDIFATIAGEAAGDIGSATLTGDAFNPVAPLDGGRITFEAEYRFVGAKHSVTVRFRAIQSPDLSGVVVGVVTDGWLKGNVVTGTYQGRVCDEGVNLKCFDGTFLIKKGTKKGANN